MGLHIVVRERKEASFCSVKERPGMQRGIEMGKSRHRAGRERNKGR